jgi:hypothetical protein
MRKLKFNEKAKVDLDILAVTPRLKRELLPIDSLAVGNPRVLPIGGEIGGPGFFT